MNIKSVTKQLLVFAAIFFVTSAVVAQEANQQSTEQTNLPKPKVIVFDVNETLLDLQSMRASVGKTLGNREDLLPLWFSTMLHNSLVTTVTGEYEDFGDIGVASLLMVAQNNGINLSAEEARSAIVPPLLSLPPHSDVKSGLTELKKQDFKIVSLTNSSNKGVKTQFENAELIGFFDARYSVEDIEIYKPDLRAYAWALDQLGVKPEEALMVAAHGWDVAGAKEAGMQTAFVARPGKALYPLARKPDYIVNNINELAEIMSAE